jgi:hypothetical protein
MHSVTWSQDRPGSRMTRRIRPAPIPVDTQSRILGAPIRIFRSLMIPNSIPRDGGI